MKKLLIFCLVILCSHFSFAQKSNDSSNTYWNINLKLVPFRLPPAPPNYQLEYVDLDKDSDPDILKTVTTNHIPVMWIDDNDNMKQDDIEGDMNGDCLLIDRNKDGHYGGIDDLVIDWVEGRNNQPAMQVIADFPSEEVNTIWPNGHYMWILDTDHDHVFNYVDWNTFKLESWEHSGGSNFFPDYSGQSMFMKVHAATNRIKDLRMNWENPFLFYDPDHDGLSERAIRFVDSTTYFKDESKNIHPRTMRFSGKVNWVSVSVDLDNDNRPGDDFDFDFTLGFRGGGFDYMDQVHPVDMHSLPGTDSLFYDPRFRHLNELIYADHALPLIFNRGEWNKIYFVYDEDDDCHRWERVEFYDPLDPFKIGRGNKGIDNNQQSDPAGDRGEWDMDNSGKGKLYISRFDGKLHLYGAEWGCWRIDQMAAAYQGWDRRIIKQEPEKFATVKYEDADHNGFFDKIFYDLDGDTIFETIIDLKNLGIDDHCKLIDISDFEYSDYVNLQEKISRQMWQNAQLAMKVAKQYDLDLNWYARWKNPSSLQQKYHNGYWLQFYIYKDLEYLFLRNKDYKKLEALNKAYYGGDWSVLLK